MKYYENIKLAATHIKKSLNNHLENPVGIVFGSGLGNAAELINISTTLPYQEIPGFPQTTVLGHSGEVIIGTLNMRQVIVLSGRFHLYEGFNAREACFTINVLKELGVQNVILTNASGALNPQFSAGSLMCITDHINFTGHNPLTGPNNDSLGPRFPDMSKAYEQRLIDIAASEALALGINLERGVYIQISGPNLETPAETRAFRMLGADAIGMSTAIETIAARHLSMNVLGLSCMANKNLPDCMEEISHQAVLDAANAASGDLARLLKAVVPKI